MESKKRCCDCKHWHELGPEGRCSAPVPQSVTEIKREKMPWNGGSHCQLWDHDGVRIGEEY